MDDDDKGAAMKLTEYCYDCLEKLVCQAAELAADDTGLRAKATQIGLETLESNFSCDEVSIVVATKIHNVIKQVTKNRDPYSRMKQTEIEANTMTQSMGWKRMFRFLSLSGQ